MPRAPLPPGSPDDTEAEFYEAMQTGDLERLMAVWADDDEVVCVHPGGPRLLGPASIRASFEAIFSNAPIPVSADQVRRLVTGTCAVHSVLERVQVMTQQGPASAFVQATNVYLKTDRGWRLVAHHASPGASGEAQEAAETASVLH
jgi:uncharacterized protein (TIGR02246 family)